MMKLTILKFNGKGSRATFMGWLKFVDTYFQNMAIKKIVMVVFP
jgi:hypothetical protein